MTLASSLDFTNLAAAKNFLLSGALSGTGELNITAGSVSVGTTVSSTASGTLQLTGAKSAFAGKFNLAGGAMMLGSDAV